MLAVFFLFASSLPKANYYRRQSVLQERLIQSLLKNYLDQYDDSNVVTNDVLPKWMEYYYNDIKDKKLNEIMIPGAHDAAMNKKLHLFSKYIHTQKNTIEELLNFGVRFLDLRVRQDDFLTTYHMDSKIIANTGLFDSIRLTTAFSQIGFFLKLRQKEIVILKIKPVLKNGTFEQMLIHDIKRTGLEKFILLNDEPFNQTIGNLINNNHRLIIIIDDKKVKSEIEFNNEYFFSNNLFKVFVSKAPLASNLEELVSGLASNLSTIKDTENQLVLYHWTITGGSIEKNTKKYVSDKSDFKKYARNFANSLLRVNVVLMDFCSKEKSKWVLELNSF